MEEILVLIYANGKMRPVETIPLLDTLVNRVGDRGE
jgi:hypothetical protein